MKSFKYTLVLILILLPLAVFAIPGREALDSAAGTAGFGTETDVYKVATNWINGFLSIFGMVFTYFMISAGFTWMTSGGNSEKVQSAKDTIKNSMWGLLIAVIAYSLMRYVLFVLAATTGAI